MTRDIKIGVSACLLGEKVRYDGGDKLAPHVVELGRLFTLVPVCPETGCGLTVPREPMRLEGDPARPRLVTVESRLDLTERMAEYCRTAMAELASAGLCGFVLKCRSPSCGLFTVPVVTAEEPVPGRGLFAAALAERFPTLPLEEEERLADPTLRGRFIDRVRSRAI